MTDTHALCTNALSNSLVVRVLDYSTYLGGKKYLLIVDL